MVTIEVKHYDNSNGGGCSIREYGQFVKGTRATGCGYDRGGAAFGYWLMLKYKERINTLVAKEFYGITEYDGKRGLDGACGMSCMIRIAEAIGLKVHKLNVKSRLSNYYEITDTKAIE
jgi:hypothetical protein